jgi:hypothetical protein
MKGRCPMANKYLATYLNDHLAGSVAAIELLEHLEAAYETCRSLASLPSYKET